LPAFVEFARPAKAVQSATVTFVIAAQFSGAATLAAYMLSPPINSQPVTTGVAANAGALDANILAQPGVFGAQRLLDGTTLADFVATATSGMNPASESNYSPEFWGGSQNTLKWPYTVTGKWISPPAGLSLVPSTYTGEGFQPLAPGVGAFRVSMPNGNVATGAEGGNGGTVAINSFVFLPPGQMGLARTLFVRYYFRLEAPYVRTPAQRTEVLQSGAKTRTNMTGKWGMTPHHQNSYGGNSGGSGGPYGTQARNGWYDCDANVGGPDEGGIVVGSHIVDDYKDNNPPGHRYGTVGDAGKWLGQRERWGAIGGLGGNLYAGHWYCIEHEVTLNTATNDGNWAADGAFRTWVDGRLVFEETGVVQRTLPRYAPAYDDSKLRPMRDLGHVGLWWNWFHGGQTQNSVGRVTFYTAPVWGTQRIGPMVMPAAPTWAAPSPGATARIGFATASHPLGEPANLASIDPANQTWGAGSPWAGSGTRGGKPWHTHNDYGGIAWAQSTRQAVYNGGGHVAYCATAPQAWDVASLSCKWLAIPVPSDGFSLVGAITNPTELATVYPAAQLDDWGAWKGDYSGIPVGLRQPGKVFPEVSHSYYGLFWVPGSAHGNTKGAIVAAHGTSGNGEGSGFNNGHYFDLDTGTYHRTANRRVGVSAASGGTIYHPGVGKGFAVTSTASADVAGYDVYDPATRTWVRRTSANTTVAFIESGGLGVFVSASVPEGLLLNFSPVNSAGAPTYNSSVRYRVDAMSAAAAAAGGGTWTALTVNAASWPTLAASTAADISPVDTTAAIGWCFHPGKGALYAVNGRHGSTTLWKLSPPAGATTVAALLSGTWTLTTETLTGPGLESRRTNGSGVGARAVYNHLVYDSEAGCLIFFPECLTDRPTAITPN
jgi:hypothetical protein